jgi:DNA-binding transcriptional ArsR family regulator
MAHGPTDIERLLDDAGYARAAAESIQALATPSRLRILASLHGGAASVNELADAVGMESSAVSHQLRVLRHLGLVVGERTGRQVVYELHDDHVGELLMQAVAHVEHVRLGLSGRTEAGRETVA